MSDVRAIALELAVNSTEYEVSTTDVVARAEVYLTFLTGGTTAETPKPAKKEPAKPKKDEPPAPVAAEKSAEKPAVVVLKTYTDAFLKLMNTVNREAGRSILKEYDVERASMVPEEKRNEAYAKVLAAQKAGDEAKAAAKAAAEAEAKASEADSLI